MSKRLHLSILLILALVAGLVLPAGATAPAPAAQPAQPAPFQPTPIRLKASAILPPALLKGSNYKISEIVQNDGAINTYQFETANGFFFVESNAALLERINELRALAKMEQIERSGVFKDSLVSGVKAPVKLAGDLVTSPIKTVGNVVKGTGSFFSNVGRSIFSSDPHQDNVVKVALGYDATKRKFAFEFLINPYSSFEPVVDRLGEISQASVAGGILPRVAMAAIGGPVGTTLGLSSTARSMKLLVRDTPPGKLREINLKKLQAMGVPDNICNAFLDNYNYDPETATILVGELDTMKGVKGRKFFVAAASLASSPTRALLFRVTARMMADYHRLVAPAEFMGMISGLPFLTNRAGTLVLPLPVDYIFWTQPVAAKLQFIDNGITKLGGIRGKTLWLGGRIEKRAGIEFARRGWKLVQNVNPLEMTAPAPAQAPKPKPAAGPKKK